ncbi:tripartite tricarboxylate transporter substrate binding protein [Bradyrhizobium sp. LHD-71]|uniref:tripartite tricarboxylate transporter substrate binding protein n=1 Tax=Bradyrhizobium sp. LHD-71 TaxID=3072141 RepID=UPI00280E728C|nr:tripartite tricarboxylate transporter substrate binding protein [Bradyrhizobium sp. LHD-71]MDQ8726593.1 tripartite tricarboxylate transporter substrate binding protein [Bradyrhizobium sp. LHD-71]
MKLLLDVEQPDIRAIASRMLSVAGWLRFTVLGLVLGLFVALANAALADDAYPVRPIRLVVPYPPGAITDAMSRIIATELRKVVGQSVVVENRPGGGTVVGTQAVKNSAADGYTVLLQLSALATNLYSLKQPGYTLSDFTPISMLGKSAYVLFVSSKYPFHSLQDLLAYGKAHPGELNFSTTGFGGTATIISARMKEAAGVEWTEVNYKGGADATQAVMSGDAHFSFLTQAAPLIHSNPDKLRLLAVSSEKRLDFLPDLPTFKELGYPTIVSETWFGLFVRSEVPKPVIDKLRSAMAEVMKSTLMQEQLKSLRVSPYDGTLEDVPAKLQQELAEFKDEARKIGIAPQ